MRVTGILLSPVAAVLTWFIVCGIAGSISQTLAAFCVFFIGPFLGFWAGAGTIAGFNHLADEEDRRSKREQEDAQRRAMEADRDAQNQRAIRASLDALVVGSRRTAGDLPKLVQTAEQALDLAEEEFADGAFAPFWDAVEQAARNLATFNANLQQLTQNSKRHRDDSPKLKRAPEPFTLGLTTLPDASDTAYRLRSIVRVAQKNFQFATIYEQRKTNQLLVGGFSTLAQAINDLGSRLEYSLNELTSSVSIQISELRDSQREASGELLEEFQASRSELTQFREDAAAEAKRQRKHDNREEKMLDNIQRRRKPL